MFMKNILVLSDDMNLKISVLCLGFLQVAVLKPIIEKKNRNCRERIRLIGNDRSDEYKVVEAEQGQDLMLECRFCKEDDDKVPKVWFRQTNPLRPEEVEEVEVGVTANITRSRVFVTLKHDLVIKNFTSNDMGIYYCHGKMDEDRELRFNYFIDLTLPSNLSQEAGNITEYADFITKWLIPVNSMLQTSDNPEITEIRTHQARLSVFTEWDTWGSCVVCRRYEGQRRRVGKCKLTATEEYTEEEALAPGQRPLRLELLLSVIAVGCRSEFVAYFFPAISDMLRVIPNYVQLEKCSGKCKRAGENLEELADEQVTQPPKVYFRIDKGKSAAVVCPGSTEDAVVSWVKDGQPLDKKGVKKHKRLQVDNYGALIMTKVTHQENGNYTCYVNDEKMQEVWIAVFSRFDYLKKETVRQIIYMSFISGLCFILYCGGLILVCDSYSRFPSAEKVMEEREKRKLSLVV